MSLDLETFDLADLVEEVRQTMVPLAQKNRNDFTIACPPDIGALHADRNKVRQNLLNLLSNACKFTRQGSVSLAVERDGAAVVFVVRDTGVGMSAEQIKKIFEPFVQGDSSTTRKYGGTGLGLAITQRFCHMMGGAITVESNLNGGAKFSMRLPAVVTAPGVPVPGLATAPSSQPKLSLP